MTTIENIVPTSSIMRKYHSLNDDSTKEELLTFYKTWSQTYDKDVVKDLGYHTPSSSAKLLSGKMKEFGFDPNSRILDMGSGTGMVGEALHKLGHHNVDAVDMSQESLDVAKGKAVYRNLIRGFMMTENSKDLGVTANTYDAVICIGVFTSGHVKGKGFDDLVHAIRPGGLACFSVRDDVANSPKYNFKEKMEELIQEKKWKLAYKVHEIYFQSNNLGAWLYVYEKL